MSQPQAETGTALRVPGARRERRDARRSRAPILAAAAGRFARRAVEAVDMRAIAAPAGVGVRTLHRRFADCGALVAAAIDERERELQDALHAGLAPVSENIVPGARHRTGSYLTPAIRAAAGPGRA